MNTADRDALVLSLTPRIRGVARRMGALRPVIDQDDLAQSGIVAALAAYDPARTPDALLGAAVWAMRETRRCASGISRQTLTAYLAVDTARYEAAQALGRLPSVSETVGTDLRALRAVATVERAAVTKLDVDPRASEADPADVVVENDQRARLARAATTLPRCAAAYVTGVLDGSIVSLATWAARTGVTRSRGPRFEPLRPGGYRRPGSSGWRHDIASDGARRLVAIRAPLRCGYGLRLLRGDAAQSRRVIRPRDRRGRRCRRMGDRPYGGAVAHDGCQRLSL